MVAPGHDWRERESLGLDFRLSSEWPEETLRAESFHTGGATALLSPRPLTTFVRGLGQAAGALQLQRTAGQVCRSAMGVGKSSG